MLLRMDVDGRLEAAMMLDGTQAVSCTRDVDVSSKQIAVVGAIKTIEAPVESSLEAQPR